jgi:hypothetical protein
MYFQKCLVIVLLLVVKCLSGIESISSNSPLCKPIFFPAYGNETWILPLYPNGPSYEGHLEIATSLDGALTWSITANFSDMRNPSNMANPIYAKDQFMLYALVSYPFNCWSIYSNDGIHWERKVIRNEHHNFFGCPGWVYFDTTSNQFVASDADKGNLAFRYVSLHFLFSFFYPSNLPQSHPFFLSSDGFSWERVESFHSQIFDLQLFFPNLYNNTWFVPAGYRVKVQASVAYIYDYTFENIIDTVYVSNPYIVMNSVLNIGPDSWLAATSDNRILVATLHENKTTTSFAGNVTAFNAQVLSFFYSSPSQVALLTADSSGETAVVLWAWRTDLNIWYQTTLPPSSSHEYKALPSLVYNSDDNYWYYFSSTKTQGLACKSSDLDSWYILSQPSCQ